MNADLILDADYWENRWKNKETGWDIGAASPPITTYFDSAINKGSRILIPGCGNAWEGEFLHNQGYSNVFLVDVSESALNGFAKRNPSFPQDHIILGDFFELDLKFDFIIEQTFFCALPRSRRKAYVAKAKELLKPDGLLVGLLFDVEFGFDHPPYGGHRAEYSDLFAPHFRIEILETAQNSIKPRKGRELFIQFRNAA